MKFLRIGSSSIGAIFAAITTTIGLRFASFRRISRSFDGVPSKFIGGALACSTYNRVSASMEREREFGLDLNYINSSVAKSIDEDLMTTPGFSIDQ